ncbi:hypothetical protein VCHC19A1_2297, partial [Vibrio cholerae HC-19A1]
MSHHA